VVYPVGMTTYWCYFSWIKANIFVIVYRIPTKLGIKTRPCTTFLCIKFQGNQITCFHFMVTLTPLRKEKKNEKTKPIFASSYLGNAWRDLVGIWNVGYWRWRASPQLKLSGFIESVRSYAYAKLHYCSSCQYTHWCGTPAFWATRRTTMCLDLLTHRVGCQFSRVYLIYVNCNNTVIHQNVCTFEFLWMLFRICCKCFICYHYI